MTEVVARAGQKVRCVEVGFGGKGCQNLTQGKEYTVLSLAVVTKVLCSMTIFWMLKTLK